jgi:hypothetical protein
VLFLPRAKKCRLGRIPLQPWVEETTESTVEDRMRNNFQAELSAYWECADNRTPRTRAAHPRRVNARRATARRAIRAAQFAPRNRAFTPRQF